jgi:hypothetical protein
MTNLNAIVLNVTAGLGAITLTVLLGLTTVAPLVGAF